MVVFVVESHTDICSTISSLLLSSRAVFDVPCRVKIRNGELGMVRILTEGCSGGSDADDAVKVISLPFPRRCEILLLSSFRAVTLPPSNNEAVTIMIEDSLYSNMVELIDQ